MSLNAEDTGSRKRREPASILSISLLAAVVSLGLRGSTPLFFTVFAISFIGLSAATIWSRRVVVEGRTIGEISGSSGTVRTRPQVGQPYGLEEMVDKSLARHGMLPGLKEPRR